MYSLTLKCTRRLSMKILNVAEKNDAAKNIAKLLSNNRFNLRHGLSQYNKIYEFQCTVFGTHVEMIMTSVSGHLLDLKFIDSVRNWKSCNPVALFDTPVELYCPESNLKIKQTLQREIRQCNCLLIWTDCDREGENIGFEVIDVCKEIKPNISVYRAKFSEITVESIRRAIQNLDQPNQNCSNAVDTRRELDLRIGASFTRFQTLRFQNVFPHLLKDSLISYGSCQFPTLGFVVERFKQRENFIREQFWYIEVRHVVKRCESVFHWRRGRIFDHHVCLALYSNLIDNGFDKGKIVNVIRKPKSRWRPLALETVEFEKLASRKLRIKAKDAMKIAEKLYTDGFISYPRTETNQFAKEICLKTLVEKQVDNSNWGQFARNLLQLGVTPRNGSKSDGAHPPIHPTKCPDRSLTENESKIYELIVRHFLACLHRDAKGMETTAFLNIDVYIYDNWCDKEIPDYKEGDQILPKSIKMNDGLTTPPGLLAEADLIALMEKHGIGTDATHAEHIETIKSRGYVGLNNENRFVPGKLGMGLVEGYNEMGYELAQPRLRSEFEQQLQMITEGKVDKNVVLRTQIELYKKLFIEAALKVKILDQNLCKYLEAQPTNIVIDNDIVTDRENYFFANVMRCIKCNRQFCSLQKNANKRWMLSCVDKNCNQTIWIPQCVSVIRPSENHCENCSQLNIVKFHVLLDKSVQFYGLSHQEVELCISCNDDFKSATGFDLFAQQSINNSSNSSTNILNNSRSQINFGNSRLNYQTGVNLMADNTINCQKTKNSKKPKPRTKKTLKPRDKNTKMNNSHVCNCGEAAKSFITRKQGANIGREFFKCAKNCCQYFEWASTDENSVATTVVDHCNRLADLVTSMPTDNDSIPKCLCLEPTDSVKRTVRKAGPNTGRQFFSCSKIQNKCSFFKWSD
ncbi:hypothetical protein GJ496_001558 [Pomphorhynchus laevis]|nr:hypothetical protein GJ496_001558 [Pomphorhynchus laevis]